MVQMVEVSCHTITFFVQFVRVWILSAKVYWMPWGGVNFKKYFVEK